MLNVNEFGGKKKKRKKEYELELWARGRYVSWSKKLKKGTLELWLTSFSQYRWQCGYSIIFIVAIVGSFFLNVFGHYALWC